MSVIKVEASVEFSDVLGVKTGSDLYAGKYTVIYNAFSMYFSTQAAVSDCNIAPYELSTQWKG